MKWWVLVVDSGDLTVINDDGDARQKVLEKISGLLEEGYSLEEILIFRGERHEFVPPQDKGSLVQTDRGI